MRTLAILVLLPAMARAEVIAEMTPERIHQAVVEGRLAKDAPVYELRDGRAFCTFSTPFSRVMWAARAAKKEYKDFAESDVTPELVAPEVRFYCPSAPLNESGMLRASAKGIVITEKGGRGDVIKPLHAEPATEAFSNAFGAKAEGGAIAAAFPLDVLKAGREVHVVYDAKLGKIIRPGSLGIGGGCKSDDCPLELKLDKVR